MRNKFQNSTEFPLGRWQRLYRDLKALPLPEAGRLIARKSSKSWSTLRAEHSVMRDIARLESEPDSLLINGKFLSDFAAGKSNALSGLPIRPEEVRQTAECLRRDFPEWVERCLAGANAICENRVSILGHTIQMEDPPDWHKDYLSGAIWPAQRSLVLRSVRMNHDSDIKFVWELSRFHHGVTLARAFALTHDERFARKFISWVSGWLEKNPPCVGPNWLCTMEVAIRAVNLLWTASLLADSKAFNEGARMHLAKSVLAHGLFIFSNLEYEEQVVGHALKPVNGNHFLCDLAGLVYISCAFPESPYVSKWCEFAMTRFINEVRTQVDDDGVHWEYSPGYHRLVLEMILSCLVLLERQGHAIPADVLSKTLKMVEFIRHYRKPGGGVPLIRDIDNSRFCILGGEELTSHDHLLALGAIYFDKPELYPGRLFEDCLWCLGAKAYEWHKRIKYTESGGRSRHERNAADRALIHTGLKSRLYRQSGFALMREGSHYLLAICCPQGINGFCGHTHNDFLSFELEAYGRTFLTDCGSYVYTQSPEWRNHFRSTASHNTVIIDGQEQNRFNEGELFEIDSRVRPEILHWETNRIKDLLEGAYTLPMHDNSLVTHRRRFVFVKAQNLWLIRDRFIGAGRHTIESRFHFDEGLDVASAGNGIYRTLCMSGANLFLRVAGPAPFHASIDKSWISRTYAEKHPIQVLRLMQVIELPFEQWYFLTTTPPNVDQNKFPTVNWMDFREAFEKDDTIIWRLGSDTRVFPEALEKAQL